MFAKSKTENPDDTGTTNAADWFDLPTMARIFGVTPQGFAKTVRPLIPAADIKGAGKRGAVRIRARGAIDAWTAHQATTAKGIDPMLAGGDSPNLERYRAARADIAEMEAAERRQTHVCTSSLDEAITRMVNVIRGAGEVLQRRWGNDASDVLNEALDAALAQWKGAGR